MQNNTTSVKDNEKEIDLFQLFLDVWNGLRRQGWLFTALISIVGTILFFAARLRYVPYYEAYTTFTVNTVSTVSYNSKNQKNLVTNKMGKVFPYILTSDALKSLVMEDMGFPGEEEFPADISASVVQDTNLVTLNVKAYDPQIAYDVLRSVLRNYPTISEVAIGEVALKQMDESGFPSKPANTSGARVAAALGMLATLILCIVWLTFKSVTRKTIRTEDELTHFFNAEYLGNIPSVVFKKRSQNQGTTVTIDSKDIPFAFVESIRSIRHRVERESKKYNAKTILVTSALPHEGKTTTATNLAIALANRKHNVLLLDGDLRDPSVLAALGMEPVHLGVTDVLLEKCKIEEALLPYKDNKHLVLLPGGTAIGDPTALWSSSYIEKILKNLREQCDYVIIDTPPSAVFSDPSLIARYVDGSVFVVRQDYAEIDTIREGLEMFTGTGCKLLGCLLNHADTGGGYGYGRYGYGRYGYGKYGYSKYGYSSAAYGYGEDNNNSDNSKEQA